MDKESGEMNTSCTLLYGNLPVASGEIPYLYPNENNRLMKDKPPMNRFVVYSDGSMGCSENKSDYDKALEELTAEGFVGADVSGLVGIAKTNIKFTFWELVLYIFTGKLRHGLTRAWVLKDEGYEWGTKCEYEYTIGTNAKYAYEYDRKPSRSDKWMNK